MTRSYVFVIAKVEEVMDYDIDDRSYKARHLPTQIVAVRSSLNESIEAIKNHYGANLNTLEVDYQNTTKLAGGEFMPSLVSVVVGSKHGTVEVELHYHIYLVEEGF